MNIQRISIGTERTPLQGFALENELAQVINTFNSHNSGLMPWDQISLKTAVVTSGASYTAVFETVAVINKTVGSATGVTLPSSPIKGRVYIVKDGKGDGVANNITVSPAAGTIDGAGTKVINTAYGVFRFIYNGTEWNTW